MTTADPFHLEVRHDQGCTFTRSRARYRDEMAFRGNADFSIFGIEAEEESAFPIGRDGGVSEAHSHPLFSR